jgi:hypothetical protein
MYWGGWLLQSIASNFAKLNMQSITETVNEKHMAPWMRMCQDAGISNTPLSPYLDKELLYNNATSVDGTAIEATGFACKLDFVTVVRFSIGARKYPLHFGM